MIVAFIMVAALMALIPALGALDGIWTIGAVSAILAAALMTIAVAMPVGNLARFMRLLRPVLVLVLCAPALWMLLQVMPVPARLANPIWQSAAAALNQRFAGTITIDVGATLLSLAQYCAVVATAFAAAAVALDRQRAKHILYILVIIAALVVVRQIAQDVTSPQRASAEESSGWAFASVVAVAGILLSSAATIQAIEQLRRSGRPRRSGLQAIFVLVGAIPSLLICAGAILVRANPAAILGALFGTGTLLAAFAIRRWLFGPWGTAGLAAAAVIGLLGAFAAIPVMKNADPTVAFSAQDQAATERMLPDVLPTGSGAGTFSALLPIYRDTGETSQEHPTAAAAITIEMGPAFLWGSILVAVFGAWALFNRSLSRGHDYIYAAAGAGALISLPIMAFVNGGILNFGASLMIGVLCGLAFAQSQSGAARDVMSLELQDPADDADDHERNAQPAPFPYLDRMWPRLALAIFGLLLTEQAAWILLAERYPHDEVRSPMDQNAAATGVRREEIGKAASTAKVRGDLWADSGFALVARPWADPAVRPNPDNVPEPALNAFIRTLHYSPHRGDVWLMLAALANRYRLAGYDTGALLKMSYYTAPNELGLLPLRLRVALGDDAAVNEPELRDMIKRDISLVLSRQPALKPALLDAYRSASGAGKMFADDLISEVDPGYLKTIRTQYP